MDKLQQVKAGVEHQKFNGVEVSYGIAPILSTLGNLANSSDSPKWTLFLINVETIIRDREQKDHNITASEVLTDCDVLSQYISAYCRHCGGDDTDKPIVCFYLPHYENIPKQYLREKFPQGTEIRWGIRNSIEMELKRKGFQPEYDGVEVLFSVPGKISSWPHRDVLQDLTRYKDRIRFRKVLMVSHVPLDFHLCRAFRDFTIMESYTGNLKTLPDFGRKVFQDENVPFNKYTHLLLGDKWYLKSLIPSKSKRELKEVAAKERWNILSDKLVLEKILQHHYCVAETLTHPDI